MMEKERRTFRNKKNGRVYTIEKMLGRGLLILRSEDGLSSVLTNEESMEFYFVKETCKNTEAHPSQL